MAASILDRCIKTLGPASKVQTFQHNLKISWSLHLQMFFFLNCHMLECYIPIMSVLCFLNSTYPGLRLINSRELFPFCKYYT